MWKLRKVLALFLAVAGVGNSSLLRPKDGVLSTRQALQLRPTPSVHKSPRLEARKNMGTSGSGSGVGEAGGWRGGADKPPKRKQGTREGATSMRNVGNRKPADGGGPDSVYRPKRSGTGGQISVSDQKRALKAARGTVGVGGGRGKYTARTKAWLMETASAPSRPPSGNMAGNPGQTSSTPRVPPDWMFPVPTAISPRTGPTPLSAMNPTTVQSPMSRPFLARPQEASTFGPQLLLAAAAARPLQSPQLTRPPPPLALAPQARSGSASRSATNAVPRSHPSSPTSPASPVSKYFNFNPLNDYSTHSPGHSGNDG